MPAPKERNMGMPQYKNKPKLTVKEATLVKARSSGKTVLQSAKMADYMPNASDETKRVEASRILQKPHVKQALYLALEAKGITPEKIVAPVAEALEHEDLEMRLKGHDRAVKLVGIDKNDSPTINNFGNLLMQQKDKYSD